MMAAFGSVLFDAVQDFGPAFTGFRNDPEGAIRKLLHERQGEVEDAYLHPEIGPVGLVYGNAAMGLMHIIANRGMAFVDRIPHVLRHGEVVRDKAGLKRVYLVEHPDPAHVLVIRLDWDGKDKAWLVTSFTDDKGKFAGNKGTSNILDSSAAMLDDNDANKVCVPAATLQTSESSIDANSENVKRAHSDTPDIVTEDNLRVVFDDAAIDDLLLAAEINGTVAKHAQAVQSGDLLAEMDAAKVLLALLGRLQKPARAVILQNRDRGTPAMIAQMNQIASAPDYYRVAPTKEFASGTPIVFGNDNILPSGAVIGRSDKAVAADGRRFPVRYAVVEASDLLTSNKADGTAIDAYAGGQHGKLRAIAGNGRLAGLIAGFDRGTNADYVRELAEDDAHGVNPDAIAKFAQPVLVRIMNQEDVTENIGDISNQKGTSDLSPVEQAQNDSKRLDLTELDIADDGKPGDAAALAFIAAMPESERNNLMDGKNPSQKAYDRLLAAVFWKAYGDAELVRLYAQSVDPEVKTILGGMASASGDLAKLEGAGELDIRSVVTEAAGLAVNAKRQGVKLSLFAQQADMTIAPDTMDVVKMFAENSRSAKKIGERLRAAARFAFDEFTKEDNDMFGTVQKASRAQVLAQLDTLADENRGWMFDAIDPLLELELSGKLIEKTAALQEAGEDDPLSVVAISGEIIAIIKQLNEETPEAEPAASDITYRAKDDMFTSFTPNTPAGEEAWKKIAEQSEGSGNVLNQHVDSTIKQLRAAGYTVSKGKKSASMSDEETDELLNALTAEPAAEAAPELAAADPYKWTRVGNFDLREGNPDDPASKDVTVYAVNPANNEHAGQVDVFEDMAAAMEFAMMNKDAVPGEPSDDGFANGDFSAPQRFYESEWTPLRADIMSSMASIIGIDKGELPGYDRALFVSSIAGKIRRAIKNRKMALAGTALAFIAETQKPYAKPIFSPANKIWGEANWEMYAGKFAKAPTAPEVAPVAAPVAAAIATLENALEVAENNEPINRAAGNIEQADLQAEVADSLKTAIDILEAEKPQVTEAEGRAALAKIKQYMPKGQRAAIAEGMNGEEAQFFFDKMAEMADLIDKMPKTYGTDGEGNKAIVSLHYFRGNSDWYITEKDKMGNGTEQAFGYAILNGDRQNAELGYISIEELVSRSVELDLYWDKKTLAMIKSAMDKADEAAEAAEQADREARPADPVAAMLAQAVAGPFDHQAWTLPTVEIESLPADDYATIIDKLGEGNYHAEVLAMMAARTGNELWHREALKLIDDRIRAGYLTPELSKRSASLSNKIKGIKDEVAPAPDATDTNTLESIGFKNVGGNTWAKSIQDGENKILFNVREYGKPSQYRLTRSVTFKSVTGAPTQEIGVYASLDAVVAAAQAEFAKVTPQQEAAAPAPKTKPQGINMENYIKVASDAIGALRRIDVYRVLNALSSDNIDGVTRNDLADYIVANRADLKQEVTDVMAEEFADAGWNAGTIAPVELPVPPAPVGSDDGKAADLAPANPQRDADLAFLNGVLAKSVDMWDDDLADRIEKMGELYASDAGMMQAWGEAIKSYTDYMTDFMQKK